MPVTDQSFKNLLRLGLILELVQKRNYPSKADILQHLAKHDLAIDDRTFERYKAQLRESFKVHIDYKGKERGYEIDEINSPNLDQFRQYLEIVATAELLNESLENPERILPHIDFEDKGRLEGIELLKPLLRSIRDKRWLNFNHTNYYLDTTKAYRVMPMLLKEYYNRWYLVAILPESKEYRTFGIDRIKDLEIDSQSFSFEPKTKPKDLFRNIVGLMYSENKIEHILLEADVKHAKYLKSLPLHWSQQVEKETPEKVYFRYHLIPNYEFRQKVLAMDFKVSLLEPAWLAQEFKDTIQQMLKNYQS